MVVRVDRLFAYDAPLFRCRPAIEAGLMEQILTAPENLEPATSDPCVHGGNADHHAVVRFQGAEIATLKAFDIPWLGRVRIPQLTAMPVLQVDGAGQQVLTVMALITLPVSVHRHLRTIDLLDDPQNSI